MLEHVKHKTHKSRKSAILLLTFLGFAGILKYMNINEEYRLPGQLIDALLSKRGWDQNTLAIILDVSQDIVNRMISGKRSIDGKMALLLGEVFGVEAEAFLELQKKYDLAQAQIVSRPDPKREIRAHLYGALPISEMKKRGWLDVENIRDVPKIESELTKFFGVDSVDEIEILPHAAKKTNTSYAATAVQLAWIYRVKKIADGMIVSRYSPAAVRKVLASLNNLLETPEEIRKVPRILAECGIRFVIVESLKSAKIDGVCFWLDKNSPVIGMSLRFDRIDNFWFVLRHELEHVLQLHGRDNLTVMVNADPEDDHALDDNVDPKEELIANEAAVEFCTPKRKLDSFIARKAPFFKEIDIIGFAASLHVHPGIIAGQLQHNTGRYDRFRQHQVKIRSFIIPYAMVDGWGDIAPISL